MVWLANPERYGQMQYRYCGKSGLRLPALSLGLWHNFGHVNALESQRAILRKAFDLGITHFDLANNYGPPPGSAEENFGRLLREDFAAYRDELIISTKAGYDMWVYAASGNSAGQTAITISLSSTKTLPSGQNHHSLSATPRCRAAKLAD